VLVRIRHSNGKEYTLPVAQVIVLSDDGRPLAVTYEESGLVVHNDASRPDFSQACRKLNIRAPEVQVLGEFQK
jgi:hypothetical protein